MNGVPPRRWRRLAALSLASAAAFAVLLSASLERTALNYGVETDFLGSFVPEAGRFLEGSPLHLDFHPPLYPIVLALVYSVIGDWLRSGLLISLIASFAAAFSCFHFFRLRYGIAPAIGGVAGLAVSGTFISFSLQASSDVFFLALFLGALAVLASAEVRDRPLLWFLGAVLMGLAVLTRTNGVAMLAFLLAAATSRGTKAPPLRACALALVGLSLPLAAWFALSTHTGSPLLPRYTYENLALTYFAEGDRTSSDALRQAAQGVTSAWEVFARNPRRVVRVYLRDLALNIQNLFTPELLPFPFCHLAFPGLCVFVFVHRRGLDWVLPFGLLAMFLLLNFKAWEGRHYLYLVPFMGAGIAASLAFVHTLARRAGAVAPLVLAGAFSVFLAAVEVVRGVKREGSDLSFDSVSAAATLGSYGAPRGSVIIARKPHVCFYAGLECEDFPDVDRVEDLQATVAALSARRAPETKIFLFYGFAERELRPGLWALHVRDLEAPWLRRIGMGKENRKWVLFEVVREAFGPPRPGASDVL